MPAIRVLVVDDHALFRQGLVGLLRSEPDFEVVGEAGDGEVALQLVRQLQPDVILMDVKMPCTGGIHATERLLTAAPELRVVILTASEDDDDLFEAIQAGARAYLLKNADADELFGTIRRVHMGDAVLSPSVTGRVLAALRSLRPFPVEPDVPFTPRERDVLRLLAYHADNREIAENLVISENTVKTHVAHILEKLKLHSRGEVIAWAQRRGRIP